MTAALSLLRALALTLLIECGLAALIFRKPAPVGYVALCNLLTNPAANLVVAGAVLALGAGAWWPVVMVTECAIAATEGMLLARLLRWRRGRALLLSLALNGASFALGRLLG